MIIVAFDPGREASWARYDTERPWEISTGVAELIGQGRLLRPCPVHIAEIVGDADCVIVEEVGAMEKQGVSSMFTFGLCVGTILGALTARSKPLVLVTPQNWKKASRLSGMAREEAKTAARRMASELWPSLAPAMRVKSHHGMAEAALMARWFFHSGPGIGVPLEHNVPVRIPAERLPAPEAAPGTGPEAEIRAKVPATRKKRSEAPEPPVSGTPASEASAA